MEEAILQHCNYKMPFAITHILSTILAFEFLKERKIIRHNIPLNHIYIAGIAALIPDLDVAVYFLGKFLFGIDLAHRVYSHSITVIVAFFLISGVIYKITKKYGRLAMLCTISVAGSILLDLFVTGPVKFLWPFLQADIGWNILPRGFDHILMLAALDGVVFVIWLVRESMKKRKFSLIWK